MKYLQKLNVYVYIIYIYIYIYSSGLQGGETGQRGREWINHEIWVTGGSEERTNVSEFGGGRSTAGGGRPSGVRMAGGAATSAKGFGGEQLEGVSARGGEG